MLKRQHALAMRRSKADIFQAFTRGPRMDRATIISTANPIGRFDEQFEPIHSVCYGINMTIPIFYGMRNRAQTALSKVTYENAKLLEKDTEVKVKSQVISAYQNCNDAKSAYAASAAQARAAELTYKTEKERFDLGITNMVQLTTTNQDYIKAKGDFQNAKYTLMFQKLLINYATGTLKIEDIP